MLYFYKKTRSSTAISFIIEWKTFLVRFAHFIFGEMIMILLFYYIFLFGFIVYVFPLCHILYGLIAVFILKKPKAGLCLILGGAILEALAYFVFYSSNTIPWLKQYLTIPWTIGCLLCYTGIYLVDKEKNKLNLFFFFIQTICFAFFHYALSN